MRRSDSLAHLSWFFIALAIFGWVIAGHDDLWTATAVICSAVTRVGSMVLRELGR